MKITEIKLHNFRCFDDFEIQFSTEHNVHVIIAENMAGKSVLMRALRIAANSYISGLLTIPGYGILASDHRVIGHNVISDISLDAFVETKAFILDENNKAQLTHWRKFKDKPKPDRTKTTLFTKELDPSKIARKVYEQTLLKSAHLPLINFIGTEYIHVMSSETEKFALNRWTNRANQPFVIPKKM